MGVCCHVLDTGQELMQSGCPRRAAGEEILKAANGGFRVSTARGDTVTIIAHLDPAPHYHEFNFRLSPSAVSRDPVASVKRLLVGVK